MSDHSDPNLAKEALMKRLAARGIREAAEANDFHPGSWKIHNDEGETETLIGWYQPIFNADGSRLMNTAKNKVVLGWKNAESKGEPHDTWANYISGVKPLMLPKSGIINAIRKAKGSLNLVEGKADTLTMWQVKSANTVGIFGASFVPADLDSLLQSWGVQKLRFFFHNDEAGRKSAQKVTDLLSATKAIEFHLLALPTKDNHKVDINDIWIELGFNPDDLIDALLSMPEETFTPSAAPAWRPTAVVPATISTDRLTRYGAAVLRNTCDELASVVGARNEALNKAAFLIGGYVGAGAIEREFAEQELIHTGISMGLGPRETPGTVRSGLTAGEKKPIDLSQLKIDDEKTKPKKDLSVAITRAAGGIRPQHELAQVEQIVNTPEIVTWGAASQSLKATLSGKGTMGVNLLPMPFKVIAQLGGLSEIFVPGKIYGVVADSGAGKTSFIETMIDAFRQAGFSGVGWGPEWSPEEYVMRAIQRNGGPGILELYKHAVHAMSADQPINLGVAMTPERLAQALDMIDKIDSWLGQYDIVPNAGLPVDQVVDAFEAAYLEAESQGRRFAFAVVDYAQLLNVPEAQGGVEKMMIAMQKFKDWCIKRALVGIVGSQITKADSRVMSNGGNLTHAAMQNMRSDYFNWAGAIERSLNDDDETTPDASMHVLKSSLGGKQGHVNICQDPATGKWYSGQWAAVQPTLNRVPRVIEQPVQRPMSAPLPPREKPVIKESLTPADTPRSAMFAKYGSTFNVKVGQFVEPRLLQLARVKAAAAGEGEAFEALLTYDEKRALAAMLEGSNEAPKYIEIQP